MLTLTVTDNQDGTGALATVNGSSGGSWTIWAEAMNAMGAGFGQVASGTGDGTVLLSSLGYFFAYVILSTGGPSPIIQYGATDSDLATVILLQQGCVAILQGKTFAPIAAGGATPTIIGQKTPTVLQTQLPAIVVSLAGMTESPAADAWDSEGNDEAGYPVMVGIYAHSDPQYQDAAGYLLWRQIAMRALENRRIPASTEIYRTVIESEDQAVVTHPGEPLTPDYQRLQSRFVVRGLATFQRG